MDLFLEICVWIFILANSYYIYQLSFNTRENVLSKLETVCYIVGSFAGGIAFGRILGIIIIASNKNIPPAPYGSYIIGLLLTLYISSWAVTLSSDKKNFFITLLLRLIAGVGILSFGIFNSWVTKMPWLLIVFIIGIVLFVVLAIMNYVKFDKLNKIVPKDNETNKKRNEREAAKGAALGYSINSLCFGIMFLAFLLSAGLLP